MGDATTIRRILNTAPAATETEIFVPLRLGPHWVTLQGRADVTGSSTRVFVYPACSPSGQRPPDGQSFGLIDLDSTSFVGSLQFAGTGEESFFISVCPFRLAYVQGGSGIAINSHWGIVVRIQKGGAVTDELLEIDVIATQYVEDY